MGGLAFVIREYEFSGSSWQLISTNYATNRCEIPVSVTFLAGGFELLEDEVVSFTTATNVDLKVSQRTLTPLADGLTAFYNALNCFSSTFQTGKCCGINFTF